MNNVTLRLNPQLERFLSYISTSKSYVVIDWNKEIEILFDSCINSNENHLSNNLSLYLFESQYFKEIYNYINSVDTIINKDKIKPLLKKTNDLLIGFQKNSFYYQNGRDRELFETKNTLFNQIENKLLNKYDIEIYESFKNKHKMSIHYLESLNLLMFIFDKKKLIESTVDSFKR